LVTTRHLLKKEEALTGEKKAGHSTNPLKTAQANAFHKNSFLFPTWKNGRLRKMKCISSHSGDTLLAVITE